MKSPRRSGETVAAQHRKSAGPMKHRLEPKGGAKAAIRYEDEDQDAPVQLWQQIRWVVLLIIETDPGRTIGSIVRSTHFKYRDVNDAVWDLSERGLIELTNDSRLIPFVWRTST